MQWVKSPLFPVRASSLNEVLEFLEHSIKESMLLVHDESKSKLVSLALKLSFIQTFDDGEITEYTILDQDEGSRTVQLAKEVKTIFNSNQLYMKLHEHLSASGQGMNLDDKIVLSSILPLCQRTELLLASGGDDRLTLDIKKGKLNKYLSSTIPRPDVLRRGSCTCSTITMESYRLADSIRQKLLLSILNETQSVSAALEEVNTNIRLRLRTIFSLETASGYPEIVLFPSGSDAVRDT